MPVRNSRVHQVEPGFLALPRSGLADAALERARKLGAVHADFRVERIRQAGWVLRDGRTVTTVDSSTTGLGVRVVHRGNWGFAATAELTPAAAARAAEQAIAMAALAAHMTRSSKGAPVELAPEPVHGPVFWSSAYEVDPFEVTEDEKVDFLANRSTRLLAEPSVSHVDARLRVARETKYYADIAGTVTTQQRVRIHPAFTAIAVDRDGGRVHSLRTLAPATGRGWEYALGTGWDWESELATLPEQLREKVSAPSVEPGSYDLVLDPSNLALTIHETVGHATELDRVLGYEAAFAGTSFATVKDLGGLVYGSPLMRISADRTTDHGLATVGFDDEGVAAQSWDLIADGVLVGLQTDRHTAARIGQAHSTGCAYAESARYFPVQRMANVSLAAAEDGPDIEGLLSGVDDGIYICGDNSWSIDSQRYQFQFTGQRFYRISQGRLAGQLNDVAYQGNTLEFWRSLIRLGGPQTYLLCGAFNCGKGQPVQTAPVSHGSPAAHFQQVDVLNTARQVA